MGSNPLWIAPLRSGRVHRRSTANAGGQGDVTAQFAGTHTFVYTEVPEDWTVPNGITSIVARVCGASGENESLANSPGIKFAGRPGHGGCVTGNVLVAPGDVIHVRVGGFPISSGPLSDSGWPDGGTMTCPAIACGSGGGGSSDIRIGGDTLVDQTPRGTARPTCSSSKARRSGISTSLQASPPGATTTRSRSAGPAPR